MVTEIKESVVFSPSFFHFAGSEPREDRLEYTGACYFYVAALLLSTLGRFSPMSLKKFLISYFDRSAEPDVDNERPSAI